MDEIGIEDSRGQLPGPVGGSKRRFRGQAAGRERPDGHGGNGATEKSCRPKFPVGGGEIKPAGIAPLRSGPSLPAG